MAYKKVKRKRSISVTIRMDSNELNMLKEKTKESGLSQQAYIISAIRGSTITSSDEIAILKEISKIFADFEKQVRGLGTNVNQLAHIANKLGALPAQETMEQLAAQLITMRKDSETLWQSIRSSISQQNVMEQ